MHIRLLFFFVILILTSCTVTNEHVSTMYKDENISLLTYEDVKFDINRRFQIAVKESTNIDLYWLEDYFFRSAAYDKYTDIFFRIEVFFDANAELGGGGFNIMNSKLKVKCPQSQSEYFSKFFYKVVGEKWKATSYVSTQLLDDLDCMVLNNNLEISLYGQHTEGGIGRTTVDNYYSNVITIPAEEINRAYENFENEIYPEE